MRSLLYVSLCSLPFILAQDDLSSSKRGICYVTPKVESDDQIWVQSGSDLTWYYNYEASPTAAFDNTQLEFVPMLWGAPATTTDMTFYNTVKGLVSGGTKINYVLGFNEPDGCASGGSCVDAQTAAETWIREIEPLKDMGIKLGAPAVTGAPTGFNWLQNFFTACAGQCSPDFIPVHYYGSFEGLASHVGQVNATYPNMTMWVTEYNYPDATLADSQSFYNQSSQFFDRISYITHYSIFGAFRSDVSNVGPNAALLTQKGQLTDIGAWYLGETATGNVPKGSGTSLRAWSSTWVLAVVSAVLFCLA